MDFETDNRSNQPEEEILDALTAGDEHTAEDAADEATESGHIEPNKVVENWRASIPHDDPYMLDSLVAFLRRYLVCDDHQFTILALWIVHTWTFHDDLPTVAYLDIRSPEPECGKTRCLDLLKLFSEEPWFASGPSPMTVMEKLIDSRTTLEVKQKNGYLHWPYTILLDDCHHILGRTERRQQLLAMLHSGSRRTSTYIFDGEEHCVFRPMAFAGNASLPSSLAARCVPIVLRRKKPTDVVQPFDPEAAESEAGEILDWLEIIGCWAVWLSRMNAGTSSLPKSWVLTAHQEDCADPLLRIAEAIGGSWPERARAAIVACFSLAEYTPTIQVLADVRASFSMNNDPEYLLSRDLLPLLGAMDNRPWAGWNTGCGRKLGNLLKPFGISSRNCQPEGEKNIKGYHLRDFQDAWERYLQPLPILESSGQRDALDGNSVSAQGGASGERMGAERTCSAPLPLPAKPHSSNNISG